MPKAKAALLGAGQKARRTFGRIPSPPDPVPGAEKKRSRSPRFPSTMDAERGIQSGCSSLCVCRRGSARFQGDPVPPGYDSGSWRNRNRPPRFPAPAGAGCDFYDFKFCFSFESGFPDSLRRRSLAAPPSSEQREKGPIYRKQVLFFLFICKSGF